MFVRRSGSFPPDFSFPTTFEELGYFVNEKSQIRNIRHPDQDFIFKASDNDRYNYVRREALSVCIRKEIEKRMTELGITTLYLPDLKTTKPESTTPHMPIYITPQETLKTKKRVIIVINHTAQDLGVWSYRYMKSSHGIVGGSCVGLTQQLKAQGDDEPGLVILNPGQTFYSHKEMKAMTNSGWADKPRQSPIHPVDREHPVHNHVEGNRTATEHVSFVFENVIKKSDWISPEAELYLIGNEVGGEKVLQYLNDNWDTMSSRIAAIALIQPHHGVGNLNESFAGFLADRARDWNASHAPQGTVLDTPKFIPPEPVPDNDIETLKPYEMRKPPLCPVFASGEMEGQFFVEHILPNILDTVLQWFVEVGNDIKGFKNGELEVTGWKGEGRTVDDEDDVPELEAPNQDGAGGTKGLIHKLEDLKFDDNDNGEDDKENKPPVIEGDGAAVARELMETDAMENRDGDADTEMVTVAGVEVEKSMLEEAGLL